MGVLSIIVSVISIWTVVSAKVCPGLGVFEPEGPFVDWPDPACPEELGDELVFLMFTRDNPEDGQEFSRNSTIPQVFDSSSRTAFIVHGWSRNITSPWIHAMKDAWLIRESVNVVLVGWGGENGAGNIMYSESASTTRTIGAEIAELMLILVETGGTTPDLLHCGGSSLGAQVCGHAGRWAREVHGMPPGRCTGWDPAGPIFSNSTDRRVGIWTDCADFVDIIHTDTVYGSTPEFDQSPLTLGHQDFFPNNGVDHPGCGGSHLCNHGMARTYFEESLNNNCFISREVCSQSNDLPGSCTSCNGTCAVMGFDASPTFGTGIFRLSTSDVPPYCLG